LKIDGWRARWLVGFAHRLLRIWALTLRFRIDDRANVIKSPPNERYIGALWHNRLLLLPFVIKRYLPERQGAALISRSRDGALLADLVERFDFEVVRGSSSRQGASAIRQLAEVIANGRDVVLFDATTLTPRVTLGGHAETVAALRFSQDGALLATTSGDGDVFVWETATGVPRERLAGHTDIVSDVAFSADGATLYTASYDGTVLIWDLAGNRRFISRRVEPQPDFAAYEAVGDPSGTIVAYFTDTFALQFRDIGSRLLGDEIVLQLATDPVWRPTKRRLATVTPEGLVQVWDATSAGVVTERRVTHEGTHVVDLDYTPDGEHLVVAAVHEEIGAAAAQGVATVFMLDADTLEPVGTPADVDKRVAAVSAGPDDRAVVVADSFAAADAGDFAAVDLIAGKVLHEGELGLDPSRVDVSPDGQRAVVTSSKDEVGILDLETGEWVTPPIQAPRETAGLVSYSPDGRVVVVGGANGAVSLWDGTTGQLLASLTASRTSAPVRPTILDDGHTAMLTALDGGVYTWDIRPESWVAAACAIAGRNLTDDEWRDAFGDRPYRLTCPDNDAPVRTAEGEN
jgi:WD40 repeat protein